MKWFTPSCFLICWGTITFSGWSQNANNSIPIGSAQISKQTYVAIDLSSTLQGAHPVDHMALDDNALVSFGFTNSGSTFYYAYNMENGVETLAHDLQLTNSVFDPTTGSYETTLIFNPIQILSDGSIYANTDQVWPAPAKLPNPTSYTTKNSQYIYLPPPYVGKLGTGSGDEFVTLLAVASDGSYAAHMQYSFDMTYLGSLFTYENEIPSWQGSFIRYANLANVSSFDTQYNGLFEWLTTIPTMQNGNFGYGDAADANKVLPTFFSTTTGGVTTKTSIYTGQTFFPTHINTNGWGIGYGYTPIWPAGNGTGYSTNTNQIWNGRQFFNLQSDVPYNLNNQNQVIVDGYDGNGNSTEGYLWEENASGSTATTSFKYTLTKPVQTQFSHFQPILISNQKNPVQGAGYNPSIYILTGCNDNGGSEYDLFNRDSNGNWSDSSLQFTNGDPTVNVVPTVSKWVAINSSAVIAAIGNAGSGSGSSQNALIMFPVDIPPSVVRVNANFDEQKVNSATGYAQPDNWDEDLKVASGPNAGHITVNDLSSNFFGVRPGTLPPGFFNNTTVTIKKLDNIDTNTTNSTFPGIVERGTVRFYAIQNLGQTGETSYPIPVSTSTGGTDIPWSAVPFTTSITTDQPANLVSTLYGSGAAIPSGPNVSYFMEGVDPGPITLEYRIHFNSGNMADIVLDQHFLVCTQQSKAAWLNDLRQEILLQTTYSAANNGNQGTNAVDINKYILSNGFMNNRQYVQAIYNWYQELFIQKSTLFPWAGLARLAGGGVYAGLSDNQWGQNSYQVGQAMITGLPTLASLALLWNHDGVTTAQIISAECSYFQQALMDGQQLIYGDLAWQFRAYQASGIWALRYTSSSNLDKIPGTKYIPIDEQHTWETIFQADYHNSLSLTQSGNFNVTQREQQVIVQPAWDLIATDRYGLGTGLFSFLAQSPVPGGASFSDVVPGGNIANVNHRWIWVSQQAANFSPIFTPPYSSYININGIWPDWIALTTAQQLQDANGSLQTLAYNDSLLNPNNPNHSTIGWLENQFLTQSFPIWY